MCLVYSSKCRVISVGLEGEVHNPYLLDPHLDNDLLNVACCTTGSCCTWIMWTFYVFYFCFCWLNKLSRGGECFTAARLFLPPDFCFHFFSLDGLWRGKLPPSWPLLPLLLRPQRAAWERTWHVPYAAICSGSLSCWPVCTTSVNPASPGTGGGLRALSPALSVARSSAPSSFRPTTLWQPWWRRSGPQPRTHTSRT